MLYVNTVHRLNYSCEWYIIYEHESKHMLKELIKHNVILSDISGEAYRSSLNLV